MTAFDDEALREYDAACRLRFAIFFQRCFLMLNPGAIFEDNWSIDAMAAFAEQIINGDVRRGIVNIPPRHGKSQMFNVALCAFILGHDPRKRIFCISYAGPLSSEHANMFRAIVESAWYQRLFPRMKIKRIVDDEIYTTKRGYRRWTSVMGSMTGMGGDLFIVDDPIKPVDCLSQVKRDAVNQWFSNTLLSRLDNKETGAILVVMQRLHMDDLSGFLLRNSDDWSHLNLPAVAEIPQDVPIGGGRVHRREVGDVLHPARESRETLDRQRQDMGSAIYSAHYQQRPIPLGGALLLSEWFQYYTTLPERDETTYVIQSWDTASKQGLLNSYSVCTTWLVHHETYYLIHVMRKRMTFPELVAAAQTLAQEYRPRHILIEDASTGAGLAQSIKSSHTMEVRLVTPEHNKDIRLFLQQPKFEQGRVYFPKYASWLRLFLEEMLSFPESTHTDQVDSVSQALAFDAPGGYSAESIRGLESLVNGMYMGRLFGRMF
ncbi:MAG: phage terminase large subunit [Pseudolabrys sp.]|nr:phage terminase large subunit [Pseudolabrys sp.]